MEPINKLINGIILERPNRFIMNVEIDGKEEKCHCPCTGKIGQIIFENVPCLLSESTNKKRKTHYTVEAISVDNKKTWIGINQSASNKYIEHFIETNQLKKMVGSFTTLKREQKFGKSRFDFLVDNTYIEVKTPLVHLNITNYSKKIKLSGDEHVFSNMDRMIKHSNDLKRISKSNEKAIMIVCFMYDSPPFVPPKTSKDINGVLGAVRGMVNEGTEMWQVNIRITKNNIELIRYFKLKLKL